MFHIPFRTRGLRAALAAILAASVHPAVKGGERVYSLERVDEAVIVQLYADGFSSLTLEEKTLAWHLYQAALAGRDIYYDQRYARSLEMRAVIEAVVSHPQGIEPATLQEVLRYTKLFWIHSGPYSNLTGRKFVLNCKPEALVRAIRAAVATGATPGLRPGETPEDLVARLQPLFFDAGFQPILTNRDPGPGEDKLLTSANNLYSGVSMVDLSGFSEKYPLNSRLVKSDGRLCEEVYRVGGKYTEPITRIIGHLKAAARIAPEPTARALRSLIRYFSTGEPGDRKRYDIDWVKDCSPVVDTVNGFIEVSMDPREVKGAWEALVIIRNRPKSAALGRLADSAQWFEDRMPWDPAYRRPVAKGISASANEVLVETGQAGPFSFDGINLPNDQEVASNYGSKSLSLTNVIEANNQSRSVAMIGEFAWTPEEAGRGMRWEAVADELDLALHEVIGHSSSRPSPRLVGTPQDALKDYYTSIEETRASLVSLFWASDPKLVEIGLVPAAGQAEIALVSLERMVRNDLVQLRRLRGQDQIVDPALRSRHLIIQWLLDKTRSIEVRLRDGKHFYVLVDPAAMHEGVGRLLAEVQRIKSEGDYVAARSLVERYGVRIQPDLRDEVVGRVTSLDLSAYPAFVMPRLEPVYGRGGDISDVRISYPASMVEQMLEYSRGSRPH